MREEDKVQLDRLQWVIRLRFIVIAVLGGNYLIQMPLNQIWNRGSFILSLCVVVLGANMIWHLLLKHRRMPAMNLAYYQCIFDLLAVSIVLFRHGVSGTMGYLFIFVILISGILLPRRGILLIAFSSVVLYFTFLILEVTGRNVPIPPATGLTPLLPEQAMFVVDVAIKGFFFFLVAFACANMQDLIGKMVRESEFERKFNQAIVEVLPTGVIVFDLGSNIVLFNPMAEQITLYKSDEVMGRGLEEVFSGIDPSWSRALERVIESEEEVRLLGAPLPIKNGKTIRVNVRLQPLSIDNQVLGVLCTLFSSLR
ncbi:MAG: PAS domain S-box protein [Candidatus Hydrogenedentota bacterium]|nr:MAG: PAS domain S-box protein [Candidatus Hydrogenedentota bacterium]